jgi:hypothetical protein
MEANIVDSERNICQAPAVLRRGSKKYDGTLSLSNIRLHFKGMDFSTQDTLHAFQRERATDVVL